jgi:hypothetical protein
MMPKIFLKFESHAARPERSCGYLVEQWLELLIIVLVNERDA